MLRIINNYTLRSLCGSPHNVGADEGKLFDYDFNRALYDDGEIYDIIAGTFLVVDCSGENFSGLSNEMMKKYEKIFHMPQALVKLDGSLIAIPVKPISERSSPNKEER